MEITIPEGFETEVLNALDYKSVVADRDSEVWQKRSGGEWFLCGARAGRPVAAEEVRAWRPLTIIHSPRPLPTIPEEPAEPAFDPDEVDRLIKESVAKFKEAAEAAGQVAKMARGWR